MTAKKRAVISLTLSGLIVFTALALIADWSYYTRWILLPGFVADVVLSGNVHSGLGGSLGSFVGTTASIIAWFAVIFAFLAVLDAVGRRVRKKKPIQPPARRLKRGRVVPRYH